jgi:hypothetical protein
MASLTKACRKLPCPPTSPCAELPPPLVTEAPSSWSAMMYVFLPFWILVFEYVVTLPVAGSKKTATNAKFLAGRMVFEPATVTPSPITDHMPPWRTLSAAASHCTDSNREL